MSLSSRMSFGTLAAIVVALLSFGPSQLFAQSHDVPLDPKLPEYKKVSGVSGTLKSVGSDTMNNLVSLWAGEFKKLYPASKPRSMARDHPTLCPLWWPALPHLVP